MNAYESMLVSMAFVALSVIVIGVIDSWLKRRAMLRDLDAIIGRLEAMKGGNK